MASRYFEAVIITFTPNPSLDRTASLPHELSVGQRNQLAGVSTQAAGRGVNVSRALHNAGRSTLAVLPRRQLDFLLVRHAERAGARLIESAVVLKLEKGEGGKIVAALYKDPQGNEVRVEGKTFILAANGIETPKLMLMSEVGNRYLEVMENLAYRGHALSLIHKIW